MGQKYYTLIARNVNALRLMDEEDLQVRGTYLACVACEPGAAASRETIRDIILEEFFALRPVNVMDDFMFMVFDDQGKLLPKSQQPTFSFPNDIHCLWLEYHGDHTENPLPIPDEQKNQTLTGFIYLDHEGNASNAIPDNMLAKFMQSLRHHENNIGDHVTMVLANRDVIISECPIKAIHDQNGKKGHILEHILGEQWFAITDKGEVDMVLEIGSNMVLVSKILSPPGRSLGIF